MRRGGELATGVGTAVVVVLLGAPAGLVWAAIAPRPDAVISTYLGGRAAELANPESNSIFAGDGYFFFVMLVAGLACAAVAYLTVRGRADIGALGGLAAGGVLAAIVAAHVGTRLHRSAFYAALARQPVGSHLQGNVNVHAEPSYVVWAFAAVFGYGILIAMRTTPGPTPEP